MRKIKALNPVWFVKASLSFMEGYSMGHIWVRMPFAYLRYSWYVIFDK